MKHTHPFRKLDIFIPQSCDISYGHRHRIYIYPWSMCGLLSLVFCHSAKGWFPVPHRKGQMYGRWYPRMTFLCLKWFSFIFCRPLLFLEVYLESSDQNSKRCNENTPLGFLKAFEFSSTFSGFVQFKILFFLDHWADVFASLSEVMLRTPLRGLNLFVFHCKSQFVKIQKADIQR